MAKTKLPTFKKQQEIEQIICDRTHRDYAKWFLLYESSINLLFEFPYLEQPQFADESPEQMYHLYAFDFYAGLPTTLRSVSILIEKGNYNDALNLLRSLVETIVKCLYFMMHKDQLKEYELSQGKKINLDTMWSFIAGFGAYQIIYKFLCKFEHKNIGSNLPRLNYQTNATGGYIALPQFNKKVAEASINITLYSIYTVLNIMPFIFPDQWSKADSNFLNEHQKLVDQLHCCIKKNENMFPESGTWISIIEKINGKNNIRKFI